MHEVLRAIDERVSTQRAGPFISWLADPSVPTADRLTRWLPAAAPWVFGFMDLNGVLLRYPAGEAARDRYKQAINDHVEEDAQHWAFYLDDLHALGLDGTVAFPELLRFLWGSETQAQRLAVYRLSALASSTVDPVLRYCLIATIESFAHLLFSTLQEVSRSHDGDLTYVGAVHADREPGHLANQPDGGASDRVSRPSEDPADAADAAGAAGAGGAADATVEDQLRNEVLDPERRQQALAIVAEVADLIEERWHELHRCAQSDRFLTFLRSA
jgi:hypothetical protein